jgi:hypothetical protein
LGNRASKPALISDQYSESQFVRAPPRVGVIHRWCDHLLLTKMINMTTDHLQAQCELGQQELLRTNYLRAEEILAEAEQSAWDQKDFDTLARLYMPLQEARRQRRQRCGEGIVCLDLFPTRAADSINTERIVNQFSFGQLLVGGWGSIQSAVEVRRIQKQKGLYIETFLGAVYPTCHESGGVFVVIVPNEETVLPKLALYAEDELAQLLKNCLILDDAKIPRGTRVGSYKTYAEVMNLWEQLHSPFLQAADSAKDPLSKMEAYRKTIEVDYACELAHQRLADVARTMARLRK